MAAIKAVDKDISIIEKTFNASSHDESIEKERLNFGLVEVVYEWAQNKVIVFYCIYLLYFKCKTINLLF